MCTPKRVLNKEGANQLLEELAMKSHLYRLSLLSVMLGVFSLNTALADDATIRELSMESIVVSFADLNLANPEGLNNLYRRIKSAAHKVCGVRHMKVTLDVRRKNRDCVSRAIGETIGKVDNVRLTALHQAIFTESNQS